jgi:serine/threonine protein kinase
MTSVERLQRSRLGSLDQFAQGGQGRVYHAPDLTLDGAPGPLVFKEYKDKHISINGLDRMASFRERLSDYDLAVLDVIANWPVRVVEGDAGEAAGVILPLIQPQFFHELRRPNGSLSRRPRDGQYLPQPRERCDRVGIPLVGMGDRYRFCRDLAFAIGFMHKRGVCLGDISFGNVTYALDLQPCVYLVDCDAFRLRGQAPVVPQFHTPDWVPPEGSNVQSTRTDLYKLGLFVLRALTPRALSAQNRDPSWADRALDPRGRTLLRRALGPDDNDSRTSAKEWYTYFNEALGMRPLKTTSSRSRLPRPTTAPASTVGVAAAP